MPRIRIRYCADFPGGETTILGEKVMCQKRASAWTEPAYCAGGEVRQDRFRCGSMSPVTLRGHAPPGIVQEVMPGTTDTSRPVNHRRLLPARRELLSPPAALHVTTRAVAAALGRFRYIPVYMRHAPAGRDTPSQFSLQRCLLRGWTADAATPASVVGFIPELDPPPRRGATTVGGLAPEDDPAMHPILIHIRRKP